MKAIAINSFVENISDLQVSNVPNPTPSSADGVVVDITHAGLNHVDLLYARGKHQNNRSLVTPPFVLGLEFAGIVSSAPSSSSFKTGDRVLGGGVGGFAEKIVVKEDALRKVPDGWTLEAAACVAATTPVSYGALVQLANVKKGETVLVHAAAGGLGVMTVQIARALGARVIATVGSDAKGQVVRTLGAEDVVRYDRDGWENEVLNLTGGNGVDVVFDPVGLVGKSIHCLKYAGSIVIVGFAGLEGSMEKVAMNRILLKSAKVYGYRYGENGRRFPAENAAIWHGLNRMFDQGLIKPVIFDTKYQGLESVPGALQDLAARKVWGKAVVQVVLEMRTSKL